MAELQNRFTWSRSRAGMFDTCHYRYYLNYYGSWGGWSWNADPRNRRIYILKQLQSRWMWAGTLVHDSIERVLHTLRAGESVNPEQVIEWTIQKMRQDFVSSRGEGYLQKPKTCALDEHHYADEHGQIDWVIVREHVSTCLQNFFSSPYFELAQHLEAEQWLSIEEMDSFDLNGTTVWAIPDFAYRDSDGKIWIIDWKTGRSFGTPDPIQLACYALYASGRWDAPPESIHTVEYNLAHGKGHHSQITPAVLDEVHSEIEASVGAMKELLDDPDENRASAERFNPTADEGSCSRCKFREICDYRKDGSSGK